MKRIINLHPVRCFYIKMKMEPIDVFLNSNEASETSISSTRVKYKKADKHLCYLLFKYSLVFRN